MFRPNRTLDKAIIEAMRQGQHSMMERCIMRVRLTFLPRAKREELERGVTEIVVKAAAGAIPVSSVVGGVFVGDWMDIWQLFIEHLPEILEFILTIIAIFFSS